MTGRGRDWSPLGGFDPTPGDPAVISYVADAVGEHARAGISAHEAFTTFGIDVGSSSWTGRSSSAFLSAVQPLPRIVMEQLQAYDALVGAVRGWGGEVEGNQRRADDLLEEALLQEAVRDQADADLPGARSRLWAAERQLDDPALEGAARAAAARQYERALDSVQALVRQRDEAVAELARLRRHAAELRDEHEQAGVAAGTRIVGQLSEPADLLPFAASLAGVAVAEAFGHLDVLGDDGMLSPSELADLLSHAGEEALFQQLDDEQDDALARLLAVLARDPEASAEVLQALGEDGVADVLSSLYFAGETFIHSEDMPQHGDDTSAAFIALISAGAQTAAGLAVVDGLADPDAHGPHVTWVLATAEDLPTSVVLQLAQQLLTGDNEPLFMFNHNFPALNHGAHATIAGALAANEEASVAFVNADPATNLHALVNLNAHFPAGEHVAVVIAHAIDGALNPHAQDVAAHVIEVIADGGAGGLGIQAAVLSALNVSGHLSVLLDDTRFPAMVGESGDGEVTTVEFTRFLEELLADLPDDEVGLLIEHVIAGAALDTALVGIPTSEATLLDVVRNEMADYLGPLRDALESHLGDAEEAAAALESGLAGGLGLAVSIAKSVAGVSGVPGAVVSSVASLAIGIVAEQVAGGVQPLPAIGTNAELGEMAVVGLLPHLLSSDEVLAHMVDVGNVDSVHADAGSVPPGTPPHLVVELPDGTIAVVDEDVFENLANDLTEVVASAGS